MLVSCAICRQSNVIPSANHSRYKSESATCRCQHPPADGTDCCVVGCRLGGWLDRSGEIPISSIRPLQNYGYIAGLPSGGAASWFYTEGDTNGSPTGSPLRLFEDGQSIGEPHSDHQEINKFGGGRYSHWGGALRFSTSDNSDPRSNGRYYTFDLPAAPWRLVLVPGLLLLGLIGWRQMCGVTDGLPEIRMTVAALAIVRGNPAIRYVTYRRRAVCYVASTGIATCYVGYYVFGAPPIPLIAPDSPAYWAGQNIVPIGYPAFLWTIYHLFGTLHAIIIAQAVLFAAAVISIQTAFERITDSAVIAGAAAMALLVVGAAPTTAIWVLSESVFTSFLLFHVAAAGWTFAMPTRLNLLALALTSILAITVRPAGYFLIGGGPTVTYNGDLVDASCGVLLQHGSRPRRHYLSQCPGEDFIRIRSAVR